MIFFLFLGLLVFLALFWSRKRAARRRKSEVCPYRVLSRFSRKGTPKEVSSKNQAFNPLLRRSGEIEIRQLERMIVAKTSVLGPRKQARSEGFRRLASYIFGSNQTKKRIAMTIPVLQAGEISSFLLQEELLEPAAKGAIASAEEVQAWEISFIMPSSFSMLQLPLPDSSWVQLEEREAQLIAAISFRGNPEAKRLDYYADLLGAFLSKHALKSQGPLIYAFYSPPWTFFLWKRCEIWVRLEPKSSDKLY